MTPSMKVKRKVIETKYRSLLDSMYDGTVSADSGRVPARSGQAGTESRAHRTASLTGEVVTRHPTGRRGSVHHRYR